MNADEFNVAVEQTVNALVVHAIPSKEEIANLLITAAINGLTICEIDPATDYTPTPFFRVLHIRLDTPEESVLGTPHYIFPAVQELP